MQSDQRKIHKCVHSSICNSLPYPLACHKIVYDDKGSPCSYIFVEVNRMFEEIFGIKRESLIGKSLKEVISFLDCFDFDWIDVYNRVIITGEKYSSKLYLHSLKKWYSISVYKCSEGHLLSMFYDITSLVLNTSYYDELTGLCNRSYFKEELYRLDSQGKLPMSIIVSNVNGLKSINNDFGYSEGDAVLKDIANILKECTSEKDVIARISGDEFAIILPGGGEKEAAEICDKIRLKLKSIEKGLIQPNMALGYAVKTHPYESVGKVLKEAEDRMYKNKLSGGISIRSSLVSSLIKTLEERTLETEEHALRIKSLAVNLGDILGVSGSTKDELALLAVLHDIGKIGIPDKILLKPGPLTPYEWDIMKTHCEIGYRIASTSPGLKSVAKGILCHHEHWNGKGYPQGLKGEKIPLSSRIISVADAYDAMTNDRPYRKAFSKKEALEEIRRCSGKQFDPHIAEMFIKMMSE